MSNTWYLIANPMAGGGLSDEKWQSIQSALAKAGLEVAVSWSETKEHILNLVEAAIIKGYRHIIALGGDGTVHHVANGIMKQKEVDSREIVLGTIPAGTGTDWIKMYGISSDLTAAVRVIKEGKNIFQDIGKVRYTVEGKEQQSFFINVAGLGYDAEVVKETEGKTEKGIKGRLTYLWTALRSINTYKPQSLSISGANFKREGLSFFSNVGICKFSGGGMTMVPRSIPDDGLLDITFMGEMKPWEVYRHILKLYTGRIYAYKNAFHHRSPELDMKSETPIWIEADGELLGTTPAYFECIPHAIQVRVPSSYESE
ncbi:MAG: diacylglycerol kinase family protein [Bacteroidota bacterium]